MPFVGPAVRSVLRRNSLFTPTQEIVMPFTTFLPRTLIAIALSAASLGALAAIDINKASTDQLQSLKGIGPQLSARIVEARQKAGFKNWDDLIDRVNGLGPAKAARLSAEGLTVAGAAFAATDSMVTAVAPARKPASPATSPTAVKVAPPNPAAAAAKPPASASLPKTTLTSSATATPVAASATSRTATPAPNQPANGRTPGGLGIR
jgi:competence protein ComEA